MSKNGRKPCPCCFSCPCCCCIINSSRSPKSKLTATILYYMPQHIYLAPRHHSNVNDVHVLHAGVITPAAIHPHYQKHKHTQSTSTQAKLLSAHTSSTCSSSLTLKQPPPCIHSLLSKRRPARFAACGRIFRHLRHGMRLSGSGFDVVVIQTRTVPHCGWAFDVQRTYLKWEYSTECAQC